MQQAILDFVAITFLAARILRLGRYPSRTTKTLIPFPILFIADLSPTPPSDPNTASERERVSLLSVQHSTHITSTHSTSIAMESWLGEVKQLRIPRPKFGVRQPRAGGGVGGGCCPIEPPRDYYTNEDYSNSSTSSSSSVASRKSVTAASVAAETEKMRQSLQQNL